MGLVVDNFAGGGGASTGLEAALGRVDIAINHSPEAIAVHTANHPRTKHYQEDVWTVDPREACDGKPVDVAWFSPDCTHFSRAKGSKPKDNKRRGLADVAIKWAAAVKPRVILLENVAEFLGWGPLDADGFPIKEREGEEFERWVRELRALGYIVEWRILCAADYGAPTTRTRLFLVARCDGKPIVWPKPSHAKGGAGGLPPWRTAAEVIDWTKPGRSIFGRKRPLAEKTERRIAAGLRRYVLEAAQPFLVTLTHTKDGDGRSRGVETPLGTITTAKGGEVALVAPVLVQTGYGEREGQRPRALDLGKPLGTVVSGQKHAVAAAWLVKHYGGVVGHAPGRALGAITAQDHHQLAYAHLERAAENDDAAPPQDNRAAVAAFLVKYYGAGESQVQPVTEPLHTVTTIARFGLVTVELEGVPYVVTDVTIRMLEPSELAAAQGFPPGYEWAPKLRGKPLSKTAQIRLIGNSVCPPLAEALARANAPELAATTEAA